MKRTLIAAGIAAMLSANAYADVVGVYIGGQVWDNEVEGVFGESGFQTDFNLEDEQQGSFFIAVEHPLPLIPNMRISKTTLDTQGMTTLTSEFEFGGETFTQDTNVDAVFDVSYMDYTLYYELFDNDLLSFDFGITARDLDGDINVTASGDTPLTGKQSISGFIPMLYVASSVGLPFTGLSVYAEGNFLSIDDHTLFDYQAGLSYELIDNLAVDLNLTLGYRAMELELDDLDDIYSDLKFSGIYAGAVMHF